MPNQAGYTPVFAAPAVAFFVGLTKRRQRKLLDRVHELATDPFVMPDFVSTDAAGREISHLLADGLIFDFWVDHAVKQVVIVVIDDVD